LLQAASLKICAAPALFAAPEFKANVKIAVLHEEGVIVKPAGEIHRFKTCSVLTT
jgi:hypothetical protein